jgi:hypothetical protein
MRQIKFFFLLLTVTSLMWSCQKDPLEEVSEGKWNKERNILGITFKGQVGDAVIDRTGDVATISFKYNTAEGTDFSKISIKDIEISYGSTANADSGTVLNFDNETKTASIKVTSAAGESLDWNITMIPFTETLLGTWKITGLYVYGGTGQAYGGTTTAKMTEKSWCWDPTKGPAAEQDNTLTFTLSGVTDDGSTYGTIVNNSGNDGLYADFIYTLSTPAVDVNGFYRKIPKGEGSWLRNYSTGMVTFTFANGTTSTGLFATGTENLLGTQTRTIPDHAFAFTLKGKDDWTNIYKDIDRFVSNPVRYWIDITKL